MFGNTKVWIATIEWDSYLRDIDVIVGTSRQGVERDVRKEIVEEFKLIVPEYNPDGIRDFVLGGGDDIVSDNDWLRELNEQFSAAWVTIFEREV